jgi:hypothetical protein
METEMETETTEEEREREEKCVTRAPSLFVTHSFTHSVTFRYIH